ncbi:hypothetical protein [Ligilactobacillus salivarius]|uniref:hypothetical protein n=1 Tax=Ligilactobacillus salivarius TaxID=1624 RepID=UPI000BB00DFE|nr:hypothetical protein [Ligilactobacillus salivarius]PAY34620.1 hypothetical protein A8C54_08930 [Ligilactobacillus salivarius]PAY39133.1 hypothetical protein A8C34_08955 [Ligilactobacillus salivarius]PAY46938.1 hypothetical protein A8C55_06780 [Ligilactobacillus salivarius]
MHKYLVTFDYSVAAGNDPLAIAIRTKLELLPNTKWFQHLPTEILLVSSLDINTIFKEINYPETKIRISISEFNDLVTNSSRTNLWLEQNN